MSRWLHARTRPLSRISLLQSVFIAMIVHALPAIVFRCNSCSRHLCVPCRVPSLMAQRPFFCYSIKHNITRCNSPYSPATVATSEKPRILLVDDDEDAVSSLAILLEMRGNSVRTVMDGFNVIAACADFEPHVIVLDISLPNVDGYEVCRRIRKEAWGNTLPVIALSGWADDQHQMMACAAGFSRHLVKPAHPDELMRVIVELMAQP